jgi:hypothetical protein
VAAGNSDAAAVKGAGNGDAGIAALKVGLNGLGMVEAAGVNGDGGIAGFTPAGAPSTAAAAAAAAAEDAFAEELCVGAMPMPPAASLETFSATRTLRRSILDSVSPSS